MALLHHHHHQTCSSGLEKTSLPHLRFSPSKAIGIGMPACCRQSHWRQQCCWQLNASALVYDKGSKCCLWLGGLRQMGHAEHLQPFPELLCIFDAISSC